MYVQYDGMLSIAHEIMGYVREPKRKKNTLKLINYNSMKLRDNDNIIKRRWKASMAS